MILNMNNKDKKGQRKLDILKYFFHSKKGASIFCLHGPSVMPGIYESGFDIRHQKQSPSAEQSLGSVNVDKEKRKTGR